MSTIFTKIINREIAGQFVYEDDICVVVMDKFPAVNGQTLIIPKQEVSYIFDLPTDIYQHLFAIAKEVAKASDKTFNTLRTCLVVEGFEVPHVHIKLYPMTNAGENLGAVFSRPQAADDDFLQKNADALRTHLSSEIEK